MGQVANCFTGSQPHNLHASCCMLTMSNCSVNKSITVAYTSTPTEFFFCFLWLAIIFFLILFGSFVSHFHFNYYQMKIVLLLITSLDHRVPLVRELLNTKIVASYGSRCFVEKWKESDGCGKDDITVCLSLHINNHEFMQKTLKLVHKKLTRCRKWVSDAQHADRGPANTLLNVSLQFASWNLHLYFPFVFDVQSHSAECSLILSFFFTFTIDALNKFQVQKLCFSTR